MKPQLLLIAAVPVALFGCAGPVPLASKPVPRELSISAQAYPRDTIGYMTAVMGGPSTETPAGSAMTYWRARPEQFDDIYKAMDKWCVTYGGKLKRTGQLLDCLSPQGDVVGQFSLAIGNNVLVGATSVEAAQERVKRRTQSAAAHRKYVASGGAAGYVTLKGGARYEVLRFGTPAAPIDYELNADRGIAGRHLYEARLIELVPGTDKGKRAYKVTFQDGTVSSDYRLSNAYVEYAPGSDLGRGMSVAFAELASNHMAMVVRRSPNAKPSNAAISVGDIVKLEITKIDTAPAANIDVMTSDPVLERAVRARWREAAAPKGRVPFNYDVGYASWCYKAWNRPIEVAYLCRQLDVEYDLAKHRGYWDPVDTPASLGSESVYKLGERTLF